jgi:hypothetical protein
VCLEPAFKNKRAGCCTKDGRLLTNLCKRVEVERTDWLTLQGLLKERTSAYGFQEQYANRRSAELAPKPYAASGGNFRGGER